MRRQLGLRAVGHTGTLDPFATGLLVVFVGRATRLARFIEASRKAYTAVIRLGVATDTEDGTGQVIAEMTPAAWPDRSAIATTLDGFLGVSAQRPPIYSAKHVAGTRSYELARTGHAVALDPVEIVIDALELGSWEPPDITVAAVVGKGTYLRALARDVGDRLGLPAHCAALRRTRVGPFDVADAISPEQVTAARVRTPAAMMAHLPQVELDAADVAHIGFGRPVARTDGGGDGGPVALVAADGRLIAVAEARERVWQPVVVLEPAA